jgi:hypothetical protein|tara:strand:- start:72 stop:254 length:183 start_codon:yes stop_codon:yes gene_type:complete
MHNQQTRDQIEAVMKILNKNLSEIKKDLEEMDTVAGDVQVQDKPLGVGKKSKVLKRKELE